MAVQSLDSVEADDEFLTAVVAALTIAGLITEASEETSYDQMSGLATNVTLPDGRSATIMVEVG